MQIFYKKLIKHYKLFSFFIALVLVHLFLINDVREEGKLGLEIRKLEKFHHIAQVEIARNLRSKCSIFRDVQMQDKLKEFFAKEGADFDLVSKELLRIGELSFSQVIFVSRLNKNSLVAVRSDGYLIQKTSGEKCFGLI